MSQENLEVVRKVVAALNGRDIDGYLACCTEDVQLFTPTSQIEGAYNGPSGIRRFFADVIDAGASFELAIERLEMINPDRVLGFLRATTSGRVSHIDNDFPITNIYDLANG